MREDPELLRLLFDLNNILGPLVGYADLIRTQVSDPEVLRYVDEIQKSAVRSAALEQIVKDHPLVTLNLQLAALMPNILGSDSHFHQLFVNLVKNAFEAFEAFEALDGSGAVTIEPSTEALDHSLKGFEEVPAGHFLNIRISDDGEGLEPENQERIFESFFSNKKSTGSGTGLGLVMVYGVVKDMGGFIALEIEYGSGTTFTVRFPVSSIYSK
ncbi:MAG: two-component system cell cycle sensor histidine kinase/response regulator CckA [Candidatus Azotimanducaceae bacterium]|jgi:two-component system cell cycle sensor histidine kinase/response regulator CckA